MPIPQKQAEVAAQWWAAQLRTAPKRAAWLKLEPLDEQRIQLFQEALTISLTTEAITRQSHHLDHMPATIGVDYNPDLILRLAAKAADIDNLDYRLPLKTVMSIHEDHVEVAKGYGAPWVTI